MQTSENKTPATTAPTASELSGWDELRRAADQLELEIHLGGMEARDRWRAMKPRIEELERKVTKAGADAVHALSKEISALRDALKGVREGIGHPDP